MFFDFFLQRFITLDNNDGGPPPGYDPDTSDTPPEPGDDEGLQDILDFVAGKPEAAKQVADRAAASPDRQQPPAPQRSDDPDPGPGSDPAQQPSASSQPPAPPPPQAKPAEKPAQQEEVLTAEKITEYGLDPNEFKPGDRVIVTFDDSEQGDQKPADPQDQPEQPQQPDATSTLTEREQALMAALNGSADVDWSKLDSVGSQPQPAPAAQPQSSDQPAQQPQPISLNVVSTDEDIHRITSSVDEFNRFASDLMARGAQLAIRTLIPQVRSLIPKAIDQNMTIRDFFRDEANEDLIPVKNYFSKAMASVASKEPGLLNDLPNLIGTTAKVVRKQLGLSPNGKPAAKPKADNRPYVVRRSAQLAANKPQGRRVTVNRKRSSGDSQSSQINELVEFATND